MSNPFLSLAPVAHGRAVTWLLFGSLLGSSVAFGQSATVLRLPAPAPSADLKSGDGPTRPQASAPVAPVLNLGQVLELAGRRRAAGLSPFWALQIDFGSVAGEVEVRTTSNRAGGPIEPVWSGRMNLVPSESGPYDSGTPPSIRLDAGSVLALAGRPGPVVSVVLPEALMEAFTHVEIRAARADISLSGHMPRPIGFGAGWARVATGGRIRAHGLWADRIVSLASPIEISVLGGYTASLGLSSEAGRIVVENRTAFGFTATTDTGTVELRGAIYDGHVSITGPGHLIANPSVEPVGDFRLGQSFDAQLAPGASVDAPGRPRTVEGAQRLVFQGPKGDARWNACHSLMVIR